MSDYHDHMLINGLAHERQQLFFRIEKLKSSLQEVVNLYVNLVECGDCGFWNPHEVKEIKQAEELLKKLSE